MEKTILWTYVLLVMIRPEIHVRLAVWIGSQLVAPLSGLAWLATSFIWSDGWSSNQLEPALGVCSLDQMECWHDSPDLDTEEVSEFHA